MRLLAFVILLTFPSPALAQLARTGSGLILLGPDIQTKAPSCHFWEGNNGTICVTQDLSYLVIHIHADVSDPPMWIDCKLVQTPNGAIFVSWSCEVAHSFEFLRFGSFEEAWCDRRVRETFLPYFVAMGWKVPRVKMNDAQ